MFARGMFCRAAGTGLVCLGLLAFEILTTRLLSVVIDASTILFAIAFAMLGMTVATSMMSLRRREGGGLLGPRFLPWLGLLLGASYLGAMFLLTNFNAHFNVALEQAIDEGGQVLIAQMIRATLFSNMALIGTILFVPYFLFGTFISVLFSSAEPGEYHKLYAADLIGAASGCVLAVTALDELGYAGCVAVIGVSAFLGAAMFGRLQSVSAVAVNAAAAALVVVLANLPGGFSAIEPRPALGQEARDWNRNVDATEIWHRWNAYSRLGLLSLRNKKTGVTQVVYAHDRGEGWARATKVNLAPDTRWATALNPKKILVLLAGAGADMVANDAQCGGTCEIRGVEINRELVRHATGGGWPGLDRFLAQPGIDLEVAEGREFLERDSSRYDTILLSYYGAGTAQYVGTNGMLPQYLYTREAFGALLDHLTPDGSIVLFQGSVAQMLVTFRAVFEARGIPDMASRVAIVKSSMAGMFGSNSYLTAAPKSGFFDQFDQLRLIVKPSGFTDDDMALLGEVASTLGKPLVMGPGVGAPADTSLAAGLDIYRDIVNGVPLGKINAQMREDYRAELSVVTDNRPYFNSLTPRSMYTHPARWTDDAFATAPWIIARRSAAFAAGLMMVSFVLILGPLAVRGGLPATRANAARLAYFLAIGSGFMLIEIGLIRKLSLVLGEPSYAISVVLAALIFSTGLGSLSSQRLFRRGVLNEKVTVALIMLYVAAFWVGYSAFFAPLIRLEEHTKFAAVAAMIAPLGFLMGQLFPQGLSRAGREDPRLVPWAWAINGTASTSVVGFASILSYPLGFDFLLLAGAVIYGSLLILPVGRSSRSVAAIA